MRLPLEAALDLGPRSTGGAERPQGGASAAAAGAIPSSASSGWRRSSSESSSCCARLCCAAAAGRSPSSRWPPPRGRSPSRACAAAGWRLPRRLGPRSRAARRSSAAAPRQTPARRRGELDERTRPPDERLDRTWVPLRAPQPTRGGLPRQTVHRKGVRQRSVLTWALSREARLSGAPAHRRGDPTAATVEAVEDPLRLFLVVAPRRGRQ